MTRAAAEHLPERTPVRLRRQRLDTLLGHVIPDADVERILRGLGMSVTNIPDGWQATPPSYRFDVAIEVDLIEEVARVYGYDQLPEARGAGAAVLGEAGEHHVPASRIADTLVARGYQEVITYSFVDPDLQSPLFPDQRALELSNPISSELSIMRLSLWPGLLHAMKRNLSRRQSRVRIFEQGLRFIYEGNELKQFMTVSGLLTGLRFAEQWGASAERADFFDAKRDVEMLLESTCGDYRFEAANHPALHPGQTARILVRGQPAGWIGALHPRIARELDLDSAPFLWELDEALGFAADVPAFSEISRFPGIRRDIAVVVDQAVPAEALLAAIRQAGGGLLTESRIFDVYSGNRIDSGLKSVAFGLILQESSRTLTDEEADGVVAAVVARLASEFGARLRD